MSEPSATGRIPDWDRLGFGIVETDVVYLARGQHGVDPVWDAGEYAPWAPVSLSPAAAFFSYGLGVFEGLKARRAGDGRILLFRPRDHALRFRRSAERFLMDPFPENRFVDAVRGLVERNRDFVPPAGRGSFYVRPMQHAIEPCIGIRPCSTYQVIAFGCPVGNYFAAGSTGSAGGLRLRVLEQGRCVPGGTGAAKAMGNYAGGIAPADAWRRRGFDDVLYLDARQVEYVTETSGSNVFCLMRNGRLATPRLNDQILAGITRDSALRITREVLGLDVDERDLTIDELMDDGVEVFCTGTAWTIRSVREIEYRGRVREFESSELQQALLSWLQQVQRGQRDDDFGWTTEVL